MKYIKLFEDIFDYEEAVIKYSDSKDGQTNTKNFSGNSGVYKATKYAKELIEEHVKADYKFNKDTGYVLVVKESNGRGYDDLIKWWGDCKWKDYIDENLKNVYIYEKYLYGLEAAYEKYIVPSKNCYNILKYIKEKQPKMWNIISFHDPEVEKAVDLSNMGFND